MIKSWVINSNSCQATLDFVNTIRRVWSKRHSKKQTWPTITALWSLALVWKLWLIWISKSSKVRDVLWYNCLQGGHSFTPFSKCFSNYCSLHLVQKKIIIFCSNSMCNYLNYIITDVWFFCSDDRGTSYICLGKRIVYLRKAWRFLCCVRPM